MNSLTDIGKDSFEKIASHFKVSIAYRPVVDLLERLSELVELSDLHKDKLPELQSFFTKNQINLARTYLLNKGLRRQGASRRGNAAAGILDKSPLASALLQTPDQHCKSIYDGLSIMLIVHSYAQNLPVGINDAANEVRLSARAIDPRNKLLSQLPSLSVDNYLEEFKKQVRLFREREDFKVSTKLLRTFESLANVKKQKVAKHQKNDLDGLVLRANYITTQNEDISYSGAVKQLLEEEVKGEPPKRHHLFEPNTGLKSNDIAFDFSVNKAKNWVQKSETLSKINTATLNELERAELLVLIKRQLDKAFGESVLGMSIALVYVLGIELNRVVNTKWGTIGFIDLKGRFTKRLPKPPRIFSSDTEEPGKTCLLKIPDILKKWLTKHSDKLAGSDSILMATGQNEEAFISQVQEVLETWRQKGRYRFKLPKLKAALAAELTYQTRDPLLITTLAGDLQVEKPVLMYYRALGLEELEQAYQKATNVLLNIPDDLLINSGVCKSVKIPSSVDTLIKGITSELKVRLKNYPTDLISAHNTVMYFTLTLMMFATGHRPVRDPFCWWRDLDSNDEGILVSDKVVSPRHEYRYQVLPQTVKTQIKQYRRHLKQLGARLYRDRNIKRQLLGMKILSCLERQTNLMPMFFEIDSTGAKYFSVLPKMLKAHWAQFVELDPNVGRSVVCQELINSGVKIGLVELYLGHINGLSHRHGYRAGQAPAADYKKLAKLIDVVLKSLGLVSVRLYRNERERIQLPKRLKQNLHNHQVQPLLGPERRQLQRLQRQRQIKEVVANARQVTFQGVNPKDLTQHQINSFFDHIKRNSLEANVSTQDSISLGARWLSSINRNRKNLIPLQLGRDLIAESSVINAEKFQEWQQCKKLRRALLASLTDIDGKTSLEQGLSELIVIAAIFGGIGQIEALRLLPEKVFTATYRIETQGLIVEFNQLRWMPDNLSFARIILLRKHYCLDDIKKVQVNIDSKLVQSLRKHGFKCHKNNVYSKLAKLAQALNTWNLPCVLQDYWGSRGGGQHLPLHRFITLLTDKTYIAKHTCLPLKAGRAEACWLPSLSHVGQQSFSSTQCWRDIKAIFSKVDATQPVGAEKRNRALRNKLAKQLKAYAEQSKMTITAKLLIAWLVARCNAGLSKENLAFSTIRRYASEIVYPILALADSDLRKLDAEQFEAIYWDCLESCQSDKSYRLGRLYDFHDFLQSTLSLPEINWSAYFAYVGVGDISHSVNSNILTLREYDQAIQIISNEQALAPFLKARYILSLMLGYRFGLRFGELFKLRLVDVQEKDNKVILQLRGSVYGEFKSRAGVRQIPLIGKFNETEEKVWRSVVTESKKLISQDRQALVFSDGDCPRKPIDKGQVRNYLSQLLKFVSGDSHLRFHHLRHSFANRLIIYAYPSNALFWLKLSTRLIGRFGYQHLPLLWSSDDESTIKLQAVADVMGHASIKTTMASYFHFPEVLGRVMNADNIDAYANPKVMATLLGQPVKTLLKRAERSKYTEQSQAYLNGEPLKKLFPLLMHDLDAMSDFAKTWQYDFSQTHTPISLQLINNTLLKFARQKGGDELEQIQSTPYTTSLLKMIFDAAIVVQEQTQFRFYQIQRIDHDAIGEAEGNSDFKESELEARRVNSLLSDIENTKDVLDGSFNFTETGEAIWQESNIFGKSWLFSKKSSLLIFIKLLEWLPLEGTRFKLFYPDSISSPEKFFGFQQSQSPITECISDKNLRTGAVVKAVEVAPQWKTAQTLGRVIFCLLVWIQINKR